MRVLLAAYACEPEKGSEPAVGWNVVRRLAEHHELWVITRANNRQAIESHWNPDSDESIKFVYVDLPSWIRFWKRGGRGVQAYYYLWQFAAYFVARRLHRELGFDVCHHLTFAKYWAPSFLALLPIPFIWGPVGGGEEAPIRFWMGLGIRGLTYELLRMVARRIAEVDPFVRLTAKRSAIAFASTEETARRMRAIGARTVRVLPQVALDGEDLEVVDRMRSEGQTLFRLISIGNLLPLKGFHLGLRAFAMAKLPQAEYWIVGDGPQRRDLECLAKELGIGASVRFIGRVPRAQALRLLKQADVLVHPSLHDSGAFVCVEAMACRKPVICLKIGGPGVQVTSRCGMLIEPGRPCEVVWELAKAMSLLQQNASLRHSLGAAGRVRVEQSYTWSERAESFSLAYRVIANQARAR